MPAMLRKRILASLAVGASLSTQTAYASCAVEYSIVVRARFVRCDSAQFYWDASGGDRAIYDAVERELASTPDPRTRELRRQRMFEGGVPEGPLGPQAKFVALVHIDWKVTTTPWLPPYTGTVDLKDGPQKVGETHRYLWHGPPETCETPPSPGSSLDLWVTGPCCDTFISSEDGCVIQMGYVEPAPAPLREVLVKALEGR
jgi:hypothetical protein